MLPANLKFWFEDLRRQLPAESRRSLDRLAFKLRDKTRPSAPEDPLVAFAGELDISSPVFFSPPLCKAVAFYAVCLLADPETLRELAPLDNLVVMRPNLLSGSPVGDDAQLGNFSSIGSAAQATEQDLSLIGDLLRTQYNMMAPMDGNLKG